MVAKRLIFPKTWRSEIFGVIFFVLTSIASIVLSNQYPDTIVEGKLFTLGGTTFFLNFPLLWLIPFFTISLVIIRIYDVRYSMDAHCIEMITGRISLRQRSTKIKYEDIRGIAVQQSIVERLLDIGTVAVGTAATAGTEIFFCGIAAPKEVQRLLQRERDARNT